MSVKNVLAGVAVSFGKKSVNALESSHLLKKDKSIKTQKKPTKLSLDDKLSCQAQLLSYDPTQGALSHSHPWGPLCMHGGSHNGPDPPRALKCPW